MDNICNSGFKFDKNFDKMYFPTQIEEINSRIRAIDPILYAVNRNFTDGNVSYLSPYLSRGVISLKQIVENLKDRNFTFLECETFVKELAWREYYQRIWNHLGEDLFKDQFCEQKNVENEGIPSQLENASLGIQIINQGIQELLQTGYMHNHQRMYLSSVLCNIGKYHWKFPAKWMYYYLLDGDLASNTLSWQWVAGTFSQKKYVANQDNINNFTKSFEKGTYLDVSYENLPQLPIPTYLDNPIIPTFNCEIPLFRNQINIKKGSPVYIYNYYNLDPNWNSIEEQNNLLLLEPSQFEKYPICPKGMQFMLDLSKNIKSIQYFVGEFSELEKNLLGESIIFKQHPLNSHYKGTEVSRDWLFPEIVTYFSSFSKFWKTCRPMAMDLFS